MWGQAAGSPPGIRLGPVLAPSSPPLTPVPTKHTPASETLAMRLSVSLYSEFPPSIIMSPGERWGRSASIKASTAGPAEIRTNLTL